MQDDFGNAINPNTARTITARLDEGDARMTRIEADLRANTEATEKVRVNTAEMVEFFAAGRFQGPELDRQVAKPITYIVMMASAGLAFWKALTIGGGGR